MLNRLRRVQDDLAVIQITLSKAAQEYEMEMLEETEVSDWKAELEHGEGGIKITTDMIPPTVAVYRYVTAESGSFTNRQHKEARDQWYSIIKKAVAGKEIEPINPAVIYIYYYLDKVCDVGNFVSKFIVDGLMYNGVIYDDNVENVNVVAEGKLDKSSELKTEIYVVKNDGKLKELIKTKFHNG